MDLSIFAPYFSAAEIVVSIVIVVLVMIQSKGSDLSSLGGGGEAGSFRTRRGAEATLHTITIYFFIAFFVLTIFTFISLGQAG